MDNKEAKKNIAVVDYGVGNLHSLVKIFSRFGHNTFVTEEAGDIKSADAVVLPGTGAFQSGMEGLEIRGLMNTVKDFSKTGKPVLGICLGAQLLLSEGYEFGKFKGLDIIPGKVVKFENLKEKVPHIGWNEIYPTDKKGWDKTLLRSIKPNNRKNILALTKYGNFEFCSAIHKDNIYGCQFHPEKSGAAGLKIIENFINII